MCIRDSSTAAYPAAAAGWTAAAAGYAAVEESVREVKAALDARGGDL